MKHSQEEILKALRVIKEICNENGYCEETCPFESEKHACLITHNYPGNWNINDESVTVWKGLL